MSGQDWRDWGNHVLAELARLADNQKEMAEKISLQNDTLIRNTVSLEEHVKRTNILEAEVQAVKEHVDRAEGVVTLLNWLLSSKSLFMKVFLTAAAGATAYFIRRYL